MFYEKRKVNTTKKTWHHLGFPFNESSYKRGRCSRKNRKEGEKRSEKITKVNETLWIMKNVMKNLSFARLTCKYLDVYEEDVG